MDGLTFDRLARSLADGLNRRRFAAALAALGLVAGVGVIPGARAKKKKGKGKKKCKPKCTGGARCKKRKCVCPPGRKMCQGQCISSDACCADTEECGCPGGQKPCGAACIPQDDCCEDSECGSGATCQSGMCHCPDGEDICDGVCTASERICEELCCPVDVECFADGCACEEFLCRCAEERTYCSTPEFTQCCIPGDDCDPEAACTTDTCTEENAVGTIGEAFCGTSCLCTVSAADEPFCADFTDFVDCPVESACADDTACGSGRTCVNIPFCGDGENFFGVCLSACAATVQARATATSRARLRRRLHRTLNLTVSWPRPDR